MHVDKNTLLIQRSASREQELSGERSESLALRTATVAYKWRNRVSITAKRRLHFPINIHVLMSNAEIEDGLPFLFYLTLLSRNDTTVGNYNSLQSTIDIIISHFKSKKKQKNKKETRNIINERSGRTID